MRKPTDTLWINEYESKQIYRKDEWKVGWIILIYGHEFIFLLKENINLWASSIHAIKNDLQREIFVSYSNSF